MAPWDLGKLSNQLIFLISEALLYGCVATGIVQYKYEEASRGRQGWEKLVVCGCGVAMHADEVGDGPSEQEE